MAQPPDEDGDSKGEELAPRPSSLDSQPGAVEDVADAAQKARALRARVDLEVFGTSWQGMLPHPDDLRAYDEIYPGTAEMLVRRLVGQSEHRENRETAVTESNIANSRRAQWFAFIIELAALAVCAEAVAKGYPLEGVATVITSLAILAATFFYGNQKRTSELRQKFGALLRSQPREAGRRERGDES